MSKIAKELIKEQKRFSRGHKHSIMLMGYDAILLLLADLLMLVIYPSSISKLSPSGMFMQMSLSAIVLFGSRTLLGIYNHVWRYGGTTLYLRLIISDAVAGILYYVLQMVLPVEGITFIRAVSIITVNLLLTIATRLIYQYLYEYNSAASWIASVLRIATAWLTGIKIEPMPANQKNECEQKTCIAIVGAGRIGAMFAEELLKNPMAYYLPRFFIETDREKVGRYINGIRVLSEMEVTDEFIKRERIQEIVFAVPGMGLERKKILFQKYRGYGCKLKVYDFPIAMSMDGTKRNLREFDIQELLFRKQLSFTDKTTTNFYKNKIILITGGGGSIGSELCRQVAKMQPKKIVILDIYENGAYDIQQELKMQFKSDLDLNVEIVSVCDRTLLEKVFQTYRPNVVFHAAAHKHVPLMEHNCCEAVKNNVFGTLNTVELAEQYAVEKFIMISTDKAVNPTNVMGATKHICELIVQSRSSSTIFSAVRFGNVLGSNGSVIPLFRRQIENGGPVTITDKRIIRYFMTIPEATQLVLTSGAMAKNGEIFVLDMGQPVKILELAENMIRLSGYEPYKDIRIVETGLRPGEKLYEELLINCDRLETTDNKLIFVEKNQEITIDFIKEVINELDRALEKNDSLAIRESLLEIISTYHLPNEVNTETGCDEELEKYYSRIEKFTSSDPSIASF